MANFYFVSGRGDVLPLSDAQEYKLINIDGQTEAATSLASVVMGGNDGDIINNVQANPRTIILDLRIVENVEQTKRKILSIIKPKQVGKIVWEQDNRTLEISGVVESVSMPRWTKATLMQVTLHCSQPFWENVDYIVSQISEALDLHYFTESPDDMLFFPDEGIALGEYDTLRTKTFYNAGDVAVGMEIEIVAFDTVTNPIIYAEDGTFFGLGYGTGSKKVVLQAGDVVKINTRRNEKAVTRNGVNSIALMRPLSTWLQLETGENRFAINSDDENLENMAFSITYKQRYV